jgi:hypothetical protein
LNREEYTTFDVVRIIGIKMERLQDWLKRGFIKPVRQERVARGLKNYFGRLELYVIKAFQYLVENGITREEASMWVGDIRKSLELDGMSRKIRPDQKQHVLDRPARKPSFIVVYKGFSLEPGKPDSIFIEKGDDKLPDVGFAHNADAVHVINFNKIVKWVDMRIGR